MKKILAILSLCLQMATAAQAQIYVTENEANQRDPIEEPNVWPLNPQTHDQGNDDYAPLGNGLLLLAALSSVYLLGKRKEEK